MGGRRIGRQDDGPRSRAEAGDLRPHVCFEMRIGEIVGLHQEDDVSESEKTRYAGSAHKY